MRAAFYDLLLKAGPRLRAKLYWILLGLPLKRIGKSPKLIGSNHYSIAPGVGIGDYAWLECISRYKGNNYSPRLIIGANTALSDFVHVSVAANVSIGSNVLIGSKVYIGDHSHGSTSADQFDCDSAPALRPLADIQKITIEDNVWIGDGVVILAGTKITKGSIIAANSVVRLQTQRASLIAGMPAKIIRDLDGT